MPKSLSLAQIEQYRSQGFTFPVAALDAAEVRDLRADLEHWEKQQGHPLDYPEKSKSYLLYRWADTLVHHPRVLDAVEDVIGPDILVYHSTMWIKEPRTPAHVRWHQDGAYFFLDPLEHVTAWVALSEASEQAGCMRVIPGTHLKNQLPHQDTFAENNLLTRGQEVQVDVNPADAVDIELQPGEFSIHHVRLVHGSEALPQLRRNDIAERVGREIAEQPRRPVNILEHTFRVVRWREAQILPHLGVPGLGEIRDSQRPLDERQLELDAKHDVQVVCRFVGLDANQRRLHTVDCRVKRAGRDAAELRRTGGLQPREEVFPEGERPADHVLPEAAL